MPEHALLYALALLLYRRFVFVYFFQARGGLRVVDFLQHALRCLVEEGVLTLHAEAQSASVAKGLGFVFLDDFRLPVNDAPQSVFFGVG